MMPTAARTHNGASRLLTLARYPASGALQQVSDAPVGPHAGREKGDGMPQTVTAADLRADHVGSFLRSAELLDARNAGAPPERLREIEDRDILRVLAKQKELGFRIFTDGEFRRSGFMSDFNDAVDGFDYADAVH